LASDIKIFVSGNIYSSAMEGSLGLMTLPLEIPISTH